MEDLEEAIQRGDTKKVIDRIQYIESADDFYTLIDLALELGDMSTLWYIMEIGDRYVDDLDDYLLSKCPPVIGGLACDFFDQREKPFFVLQRAIRMADRASLLYALNLLYTSIRPDYFQGYDTLSYQRLLDHNNLLRTEIKEELLEAEPSFLKEVFSDLPRDLQASLLL